MSLYVVDSSVAIKWYVPEILMAEALRVRDGRIPLHCPDFLDVELAAILWKKIRRGDLPRNVAESVVTDFTNLLTITRHATLPLVPAAFDLADRSDRTVYDCLYLALAIELGGIMVTADERLVNALNGTPWDGSIVYLRDVP